MLLCLFCFGVLFIVVCLFSKFGLVDSVPKVAAIIGLQDLIAGGCNVVFTGGHLMSKCLPMTRCPS